MEKRKTVLLVGGAYQGKKAYAMTHYGFTEADFAEGASVQLTKISEPAVNHLHQLIRRLLEAGQTAQEIMDFCLSLEEKVICCDDIFCGIVPLDPKEREWREITGRCLCALARQADEVIRIQCGLPQQLKGGAR